MSVWIDSHGESSTVDTLLGDVLQEGNQVSQLQISTQDTRPRKKKQLCRSKGYHFDRVVRKTVFRYGKLRKNEAGQSGGETKLNDLLRTGHVCDF